MKKLSFTEKNNFIVKHKSGRHFSKDLELFKKYLPVNHRLSNDLARANTHTFERLDGQMLYVLLDIISPEEILENRKEKPVEKVIPVISEPNIATLAAEELEKLKERLNALEESNGLNEDLAEELEELKERINTLEESNSFNEFNEDAISELRSDLDDKDASIEELKAAIEALEKKAFNKKKASSKNSLQ
jgi:predicted RNase H-like nuclease (RuvC/YqgF family)